jgi:hypothetical protein
MLPMQKKENSRNALSIIEQAGFTDVSKQYLGNIDQIERRAMPFKLKLTMTYKRYVITAAKR